MPSSTVPPNGNGLPPVPVPPAQPPRWSEGALPRRAARAEYVAAGGNWFAESYYRSLPLYIDDLSRDFGSDIYERMLLDDQVAGGVRTFVVSILSDPLTVRPWVDDDKDPDYEDSKTYAEFCERALGNLLHHMRRSVDAWLLEVVGGSVALGNRVTEKVAALEESGQDAGRLVWDRLKVKPRNRTAFVLDPFNNLLGLLAVMPGRFDLAAGSIITPDMLQDSSLLPPEKFAILSWEPKEEDPRGTSLLRTVYEAWWEKLQVAREWLKHLSQFGSPSLWGTTAPDALDEPQVDADGNPIPGATISPEQKLLNEILKFRNGYALALPNGSTLNVLQTANAGDGFFKKIEHCERRIDRAILLAARTRMEAKHGSKADAEASQDVTSQAVRQAKGWAAEMVTRDLIYPLVRWNFGPDAAKRLCPYATLSPVEKKDWADVANAVAPMVASGFLKPSQFPALYAQLGLPPAEESLADNQQQNATPPPAPGDEDFPAGGGAPAEAGFAGDYQEPLHPRGYGGKWAPKGGDHGHEQHTEQLTWRGKVANLLRLALSQPGKSVGKVLAAAEALHAAYRKGGFRAVPKVAVLAAYKKAKASFGKLEARYGRKAAIAMAGAYLSCYAAYAVNPVLMLYLPSLTAAIIGTAEALRALNKGARKLTGKKDEAVFSHRDILSVDLEDFLDSVTLEDAEFAFGLPTPYEEGKHPRGYGGKWTNKPGAGRFAAAGKAHQAAEKELQKHERLLARSAAKVDKLYQAHAEAKAAHAEAKKKAKGQPHSRAALEAHRAELAAIRTKGKLDAQKAAHAEVRKSHRVAQSAHAKTGKELAKAQAALEKAPKKPARKTAEKKPATNKEPPIQTPGDTAPSQRQMAQLQAQPILNALTHSGGDLAASYAQLRQVEPHLELGAFQDRLRALAAQGVLEPIYWTGPLQSLPQPEAALFDPASKKVVAGYRATGKPASVPLPVPVNREVLRSAVRKALDAYRDSGRQGDLSLDQLAVAVRQSVPDLRHGDLRDVLKSLQDKGEVTLSGWSGPLGQVPAGLEPFFVGNRLMAYIRPARQAGG